MNKVNVNMFLDDNTASTIKDIQRKLNRPFPSAHISIATYEDIDPQLILDYTRNFCKTHSRIKVEYTGVGLLMNDLPPLIYAVPRVTKEILDIHYDFHQQYDDKCIGHTSLHPFDWTPHTSLSIYSPEAFDICLDNFEHIYGEIVGMRVVEVKDGEFNEIGRYELWGTE